MNPRRLTVKDDSTEYIIYHPYPCYQLPPIGEDIPDEGCQTVSIDIGYVNFAIRIETRYRTGYIKPIYFDKIDFSRIAPPSELKKTTGTHPGVLSAILNLLRSLLPIMQESRIVGIERQLGLNYTASRIFQHVLTFFMLFAPTFKYPCIVMDIWSGLKGRMLGAPKGMKSYDLKQWAIEKAKELLDWRGDTDSIEIINRDRGRTKTKGDDLADTVLQMEAWFILNKGVITTKPQTVYL